MAGDFFMAGVEKIQRSDKTASIFSDRKAAAC